MLAGWDRIDVPGATGYLDTDYAAKGRHGDRGLKDHDLVCVHVEAPDEASHEGRADAKVEALERIDAEIVGPLREALASHGDYRILVSPDHATLLRTRAHDRAPVPWAICGTGVAGLRAGPTTRSPRREAGGPFLDEGWRLMGEPLPQMMVREHCQDNRPGPVPRNRTGTVAGREPIRLFGVPDHAGAEQTHPGGMGARSRREGFAA